MPFSDGSRLLAEPLVMIFATLIAYALPTVQKFRIRLVAGAGLLVALALTLSLLPVAASGGAIGASMGSAIPGVAILARGDSPGLALALFAVVAAMLSLAESERRPREEAAILVCVTGALIAVLAGNLVLLFGGVEVGNIGTVLLIKSGRRRFSRGTVVMFLTQHIAAIALLVVAAELAAFDGTSDPTALPPGAVTASLAWLWALAGAIPILSLAFAPGAGDPRASRSWYVITAIPTGTVILLRMLEATGGQIPADATVLLAISGAIFAFSGAVVAWHFAANRLIAGRGLIVTLAGTAVAVAGLPGSSLGLGAGIVMLYLAALSVPAWAVIADTTFGRSLGAAALLMAGGLPLGFGAAAISAEFAAIAVSGRAAIFLAGVLAAAVVLAAASSVRAAYALWSLRLEHSPTVRLDARIAVGASLLFAVFPGSLGAGTFRLLGVQTGDQPDWLVLHVGTQGFPAGYFVVALLFFGIMFSATLLLMNPDISYRAALSGGRATDLSDTQDIWHFGLRPRRTISPVVRYGARIFRGFDHWISDQPQLGFVVAAILIGLLIFK